MSQVKGKRVRFNESKETPTAKITKPNSDYKKFQLNNDQVKTPGSHPGARFKENHSLDSDSEDEEVEKKEEKLDYEKMTEEDVEGAEDEVYESDGEKITPFNLREEMEEGDFDTDGNYHFKKEREIRDNWLDNIDWVTVKKQKNKKNEESVEMEEEEAPYNELECMNGIVEFMQAGESVTKAIRRLGNKNKPAGKNNRKRPWEKKKVYELDAVESEETTTEASASKNKDKENLLKLTEFVDRVAGSGNYDIYTDTYEKIQYKIKMLKSREEANKVVLPEDDDDALDMLGSNIDKDENSEKNKENDKSEDKPTNNEEEDEGVKWIYKWKMEDTKTHGPFSSDQMQEWKDGGFFVENAFVQRTDRPGEQFYSLKRIDFDLYT